MGAGLGQETHSETSKSSSRNYSTQHTCLSAGLGRDWEAVEPAEVVVAWGAQSFI